MALACAVLGCFVLSQWAGLSQASWLSKPALPAQDNSGTWSSRSRSPNQRDPTLGSLRATAPPFSVAHEKQGHTDPNCDWLTVPPGQLMTDAEFDAFYSPGMARAQSGEDNLLLGSMPGLVARTGAVILESGALDGKLYSTSWAFEKALHWTAIHIEANPLVFQKLMENRPPSDKVTNIRAVLCDRDREVHFVDWGRGVAAAGVWEFMTVPFRKRFYPDIPPFSSVPRPTNRTRVTTTPCRPLGGLLPPSLTNIHVWILDLEGGELAVLRSTDFDQLKFGVIVKELSSAMAIEAKTRILLESHGYIWVGNYARSAWFVNGCLRAQAAQLKQRLQLKLARQHTP